MTPGDPGWVFVPSDDMLREIMTVQAAFQDVTPGGVVDLKLSDPETTARMIREQTLACVAELMEAMEETGWKPWATSRHVNVEAFRSELVDAFRFWLNLVHISGMSAEGLFQKFMQSHTKTAQRVAAPEGYTGLNKCPRCKAAYDDCSTQCQPGLDSWPSLCAKSPPEWINASGEPVQWSDSHCSWVLVDAP